MKNILTLFFALVISFQIALSQSNDELSMQLTKEAIYLMENGEIDASIVKLLEARKLDPENLSHVYEIGLAYYKKKDFSKSIQLFDSIKNHPKAWDQVFQMLGNVYDDNGEREKAMETYRLGMEKFPESGVFHQEMGNIEYSEENYDKARIIWEEGIKADPSYPSNYHDLAKLYSHSSETMWSLIYGELFMLLEPNTIRSEEISKLLFEVYQEVYTKENNRSLIDKLTNKAFLSVFEKFNDTIKNNENPETFNEAYFLTSLQSAQHVENQIDILTLVKIRESFLDYWFNMEEFDKSYKNKLFAYQKLIQDNGLIEAYTRWLLAYGNTPEFQAYYDQNTEKVSEFAKWFEKNRIQISRGDILSRPDYE